MNIFSWFFGLFRSRPVEETFTAHDREVMAKLSSRKLVVNPEQDARKQDARLTKPTPQSFMDQARARHRQVEADRKERENMHARGLASSDIANAMARKKLAVKHEKSPTWKKLRGG